MKRFLPYYHYLLEVKWYFIIALLAGVVSGVVSGAGLPWMLKVVLPEIFSQKDIPIWQLIGVSLIMPGVFFVRGITQFVNTYYIQYCGLKVLEGIQVQVFSRVQKMPIQFFSKNKSGDLLSRLMGDTQMIRSIIVDVSNDVIRQPMQLLGAMGYLTYMSMKSSEIFVLLICLGTVPLCVFPIRLIGKKLFRKAKVVQEQAGDLTAFVSDSLQAPMEIRAYNMQETVANSFHKKVISLFAKRMKVVKYDKMMAPIIDFVSACGIAVTIVYAGTKHMDFTNDMAPLLLALYMCYEPIKKLGKVHTKIQKATASLDRVEYILHHENSLPECDHPAVFDEVKGCVRFDGVSFAYDKDFVLRDINVSVPVGQVVAIVGPSGAGKTSFAGLIPRFYDVTSGSIFLDDIDVRKVKKFDLREAIAVVAQSPVLFNETVMENIRVGRPQATDAEVIDAAKKAHAHHFIERLDGKLGYQTRVGERGTLLSGGQRQRIVIARAFLKDAPILILDEATSALDSESEAEIQKALEVLVKGRTTFIIAHRFSTIKIADRILVFDQGSLVADGPHQEIYQTSGLYKELYDRQSG